MLFSSLNVQVLHTLNSYTGFDSIVVFLSVAGAGILWILMAAIMFIFISKEKALYYCSMMLFLVVLVALIKSQLMVPRPEDVRYVVEAPGYSMPSTHSTAAFATAMFLYPVAKKHGIIIWSGAIAMALSRVFAGVHYPSDVIAGVVLGIMIGYLWLQIESYFQKKSM
ncbi:phosphatase PAP2 family protein [Methanococcoides sp. SA1]|nr:phosphatase PAP2 family protein [Methanococcoides sp. SA1]